VSHRKRLLSLTLCCWMSLALSGCGLSLGPQVKTQVVIVKPGDPLRIIENRKVKGQTLKTEAATEQDIGGWIAMPEEHFQALKRAVEQAGETK
jgi:hypothetical protein